MDPHRPPHQHETRIPFEPEGWQATPIDLASPRGLMLIAGILLLFALVLFGLGAGCIQRFTGEIPASKLWERTLTLWS